MWVCHFLCPRQTDKKSTGFGDFPSTGVLVRKGKSLSVLELFPSVFRLFGIDSTQSTLYTNRFCEYLYELCEGSTIQEVSRKHRIPYTTLERIYYSIASKKAKERQTATEVSSPEGMVLSLDEIAVKKGHQYETVLMDARAGSVMGMHADRQCDSAINLLSQNVLSKEMVQTVILDMWEPYHKAVRALFLSASIVIDKHHVVQKVTQALDQARKEFSPFEKVSISSLKRL